MNRYVKIAAACAATLLAVGGTAVATAAVVHQHAASPAVVHRPNAATSPQTKPEALFVPITPCRAIDTRAKGAGGKMNPKFVRNFYVTGSVGFNHQGGPSAGCGVPNDATAVAVAFKVVNPTSTGILRAWPDGQTMPNTTALSWAKGLSLGDSSILPISAGPGPNISAKVGPDPVDIVADVTGYYAPQIQALIGGDGSIDSGTRRIVDVVHSSTGFYYVDLDRPARECSPSAVTFNLAHYASVGLSDSSTPNRISVSTWNLNNSGAYVAADNTFFLTVTC